MKLRAEGSYEVPFTHELDAVQTAVARQHLAMEFANADGPVTPVEYVWQANVTTRFEGGKVVDRTYGPTKAVQCIKREIP